jgi:hypothetical protein
MSAETEFCGGLSEEIKNKKPSFFSIAHLIVEGTKT